MRVRLLGAVAGSLVVVAGVITVVVALQRSPAKPPGCFATADATSYPVDLGQASSAATIAAVGKQAGLPDHAVTVALAAALQESKLRNLPYGDRDSVGLFQQRPSQGWGSRTQILDPIYASDAFYARLRKVPGWATMPVAVAAQRVQHSAAGSAYAQWEPEARALARALTGEVPAGFSCRFSKPASPGSTTLTTDVADQLGSGALGTSLSVSRGWTVASWLVANAYDYGIRSVNFNGLTWTNSTGAWRAAKNTSTVVTIGLFTRP